MTPHGWEVLGLRPTLDYRTVMAEFRCRRCLARYSMEVLREKKDDVPSRVPAYKGIDPDCDRTLVREVMSDWVICGSGGNRTRVRDPSGKPSFTCVADVSSLSADIGGGVPSTTLV